MSLPNIVRHEYMPTTKSMAAQLYDLKSVIKRKYLDAVQQENDVRLTKTVALDVSTGLESILAQHAKGVEKVVAFRTAHSGRGSGGGGSARPNRRETNCQGGQKRPLPVRQREEVQNQVKRQKTELIEQLIRPGEQMLTSLSAEELRELL